MEPEKLPMLKLVVLKLVLVVVAVVATVGAVVGGSDLAEATGWEAGAKAAVGVTATGARVGAVAGAAAARLPAMLNLRSPERLLASLSIRLPAP